MVVNTREFFDAVAILTDQKNMRVTMKQSAKGALICATTTFLGGLLGGPLGMAVGSTIGGVGAYQMSKGQFKSVSEIIKNDLSDSDREKLLEHIMAAVRDVDVTDGVVLLPMLMNSAAVQEKVLSAVVSYIGKEMSLQLID